MITSSFHLVHEAKHQIEHAEALKEGLARHGIHTDYGVHNQYLGTDLAIIWSWKQPELIRRQLNSGKHLLVMERGFIPNRMEWCSLSFDGFNGRGKGVKAPDDKRFKKHFEHLYAPWQEIKEPTALVIGQVPNDPSLNGLDINEWVRSTCIKLHDLGWHVIYRPHPWVVGHIRRGTMPHLTIPYTEVSYRDLQHDFCRAGIVVTYSSNTATESVLQGIPTIAMDEGSVAYPVTSHTLNHILHKPNRDEWRNDLSYRQWSMEELRNGDAWDFMKSYLKL